MLTRGGYKRFCESFEGVTANGSVLGSAVFLEVHYAVFVAAELLAGILGLEFMIEVRAEFHVDNHSGIRNKDKLSADSGDLDQHSRSCSVAVTACRSI